MTNAESKEAALLRIHGLMQRILNSRYVFFALIIHMGALAFLGTLKLVEQTLPPIGEFHVAEFIRSDPKPVIPISHRPPESTLSPHKTPSAPEQAIPGGKDAKAIVDAITIREGSRKSLFRPMGPREPLKDPGGPGLPGPTRIVKSGPGDKDHYEKVLAFQPWVPPDERGRSIPGRIPIATFTCYQAKYADGDWNCNPTALENMLIQIGRWSKDRIRASVQPKAISVGDDEIFQTKPPFLFLTGHKDFHFTEEEVANLREYLLVGGLLWVDNSLPGRRSRFDVALRREMKRVFSDRDFETVPKDHPIFEAHFRLKEVPAGMNHYAEPIEHIRFLDESVVIYTQNAYSDLWETALNEHDKIDLDTYWNENTGELYTKWGPHWGSYLTGFLYRNVNEQSIVEANRLALNIIVHMLTQYDKKFKALGLL